MSTALRSYPVFQVRAGTAYQEWFRRFKDSTRLSTASLLDVAVAEFAASSSFTLIGSEAHLRRLNEVRFPCARALFRSSEPKAPRGLVVTVPRRHSHRHYQEPREARRLFPTPRPPQT